MGRVSKVAIEVRGVRLQRITQALKRALRTFSVLAIFALMVLAGSMGMAWALAVPKALGQTIPWPADTPTPKPTDIPIPTSTWTPRPTWTSLPTRQPEQPAVTMTPVVKSPTPTRALDEVQPTIIASLTEQPPLPSPTPEPASLAFEILVEPLIAGPMDDVHFIVQVANVGRGPANDVKVEAILPHDLLVQSVGCDRCTMQQESGRLTLTIGHLPSGEQLISSVVCEVGENAWPGQTLLTLWMVTADDVPPQRAQARLELPWAELPAVGEVGEHLPGAGKRN